MHDTHYDILRTGQELEAFVPAWKKLWEQDPDATPFQRPEWLLPWWHQFGQPDLRAITISQRGMLVGFLPFYMYPDPGTGERQLLLLGVGTTDYLNGLFAPECAIEHIHRALEILSAEGGWDVLCTTQLPPHAKLARAMESFPTVAGFSGESCSRTSAMSFAELPQKLRRNAMYYRNRALRQGPLELRMADSSNWSESYDALVRLHTDRWQARGEPGVLADARVLNWHSEAIPALACSGHLRLCTLRLNREIIGVLYSLVDPPGRAARTQYFYLTAYSSAHAELRPGTLLLAFAMDAAARDGFRVIDMLRGDESYKQIWHLQRFPTRGFALQHPARNCNRIRLAKAFA